MTRELTTIRWDGNIPEIITFEELCPGDIFSLCYKDGTLHVSKETKRLWWTAESFPYL